MFYTTPARASANRLKKVLVCDKNELNPTVSNIIKSDTISLLNNYVCVDKDSVFVNFNINAQGGYDFCITGKATSVKSLGIYDKSQF